MQPEPDHYATLGLERGCDAAQIRTAYRLLMKQHHPDANPDSPQAAERTRELNAAYEVLIDPASRRAYDRDRDGAKSNASSGRASKIERNISQDAHLRIEDFLRGTSLEVRVTDPANPNGQETYQVTVQPCTAPGTRMRLPRTGSDGNGFVVVRLRAMPGFRFKVRGSDLRCDLRINSRRATDGGTEIIAGPTGAALRVQIPPRVARGEILRVSGEGMPKPRGGRGDLLVRITYRPEVRISRTSRRSVDETHRRRLT